MRPKILTLSGWGPYPGVEQVDFDMFGRGGLFLVTGPTGAGKTTVFDGIAFALFGEVSGSIREKDGLRSDFAKPDTPTLVTLTFSHQGKEYRVVRNPRYDRPKLRGEGCTTEAESGELYEGENLTAVGGAQVTEAVKQLLGLDYFQFKQISMIAQGEFQQLLVASSKERTRIFRDIFQTRLYDVITGELSAREKQITAAAEETRHRAEEITCAFQMEGDQWKDLLEKKNRNYAAITELVQQEQARLFQEGERLKEELSRQEQRYRNGLTRLERCKQHNQQLARYEKDLEKLSTLRGEMEALTLTNREWKRAYDGRAGISKELEAVQEELHGLRDRKKGLEQWLDLQEQLEKKQKEYLELDGEARARKQEYEEQDDRSRKAAAGILAGRLKEGQPCPVCGAVHHPSPARAVEDTPDEAELERLKRLYETAWTRASKVQSEAASLAGMVRALKAQIVKDNIEMTCAKDGRRLSDSLAGEMETLEQQAKKLDGRIKEVTEGYQNSLLGLSKVKASIGQLKEGLYPPSDQTPKDVTALSGELLELEKERRRLSREKEQSAGRYGSNQKALASLKKRLEQKEALEQEYGVVREVERAASGYNNRNLVFEQYVLSVYFEDILSAANRRLLTMTGGRYELFRLPQSKDRRTKEGMELEVLDQYTGKRRSVRSLSGGESFKAALALALGTADVVQAYAGGIQVETMFVDEGFGSLDSESLNQAIAILTSLGDSRRMIGIISHVEELKERIDNQIVIEKTAQGSRIRCNH